METPEMKKIVETLLFITEQPLTLKRLCDILGESDKDKVISLVQELRREYAERETAFQIVEIADGFQMASRSEYAPFVRKLYVDKMTMRLSSAALETLSIVAYKQPLTRAEIEDIRGVEVIAALETLLDKRLIRVVGRRDSVGRPLLYGTTPDFMRHFGLKSLDDLPPIDSFTPPPVEPAAAEPQPAGDAESVSQFEGIAASSRSQEDAADSPASNS